MFKIVIDEKPTHKEYFFAKPKLFLQQSNFYGDAESKIEKKNIFRPGVNHMKPILKMTKLALNSLSIV